MTPKIPQYLRPNRMRLRELFMTDATVRAKLIGIAKKQCPRNACGECLHCVAHQIVSYWEYTCDRKRQS